MKRKALTALATLALTSSLAGCALFNSKLDPSPELEFTYAAVNGPATGLVRAFVLNGSTVLQFVDITQVQPRVYAADQATALPYQVIGQYAILSGIHSSLRVSANGATATVTATRAPAPKPPAETVFPGAPRPSGAAAAAMPAAPAAVAAVPAAAAPAATPTAQPVLTVTPSDLMKHDLQELAQLRKEVADMRQKLMAENNTGAGAGGIVPTGSAIKPAALIVPVGEVSRTWTLSAKRTLKDNLTDMLQQAGYTITWKASNPYMVTYTKHYNGTLQDAIGEIALEVPALDFRLYAWKRRLDVVDATN